MIIEFLSKAPSNLTIADLEDFCSLGIHYASNTPQSFRKLKNEYIDLLVKFIFNFKEFDSCLFSEIDRSFSQKAYSIYQALCLPISVRELLQANQLDVSLSPPPTSQFPQSLPYQLYIPSFHTISGSSTSSIVDISI